MHKLTIGIGLGAMIGAAIGWGTGSFPITASPLRGALVGALAGLFLTLNLGAAAAAASRKAWGAARNATAGIVEIASLRDLTERLASLPGRSAVVFSAPGCSMCRRYETVVSAVATVTKRTADIFKINPNQVREAAGRYGVTALPTTVFFEAGQEVGRLTGMTGVPELAAALHGRTS